MTDKRKDLQIVVTGKHIDITDAIRAHAEDKVNKLPRYYDGINYVEVILDAEHGGDRQTAEVVARAEHGLTFVANETGNDTYTCIDMAVHKVERQISKHKEKERNNKHIKTEMPE